MWGYRRKWSSASRGEMSLGKPYLPIPWSWTSSLQEWQSKFLSCKPPSLVLCYSKQIKMVLGFPGGSVVKNPPANAGDVGSIPGGGHGIPLQYSCLENSMDRGAWWVTVHGVIKSWTGLSTHLQMVSFIIQGLNWQVPKFFAFFLLYY